jgi:hypothetical protein
VWRSTAENTRTAFAVAILGIWEHVQRRNGLPPGADLTAAARRWAQHRLDSRISQAAVLRPVTDALITGERQ